MTRIASWITLAALLTAALPAQITWWDKDLAAALTAAGDSPPRW